MADTPPVDQDAVRALARAAALPLGEDRLAAAAALLGAWTSAANELSRIMSASEHRTILPITSFAHPPTEPTE